MPVDGYQEPQNELKPDAPLAENKSWATEVGSYIKESGAAVPSDDVRMQVEIARGPAEFARGSTAKSDVELARALSTAIPIVRFSKSTGSFSWREDPDAASEDGKTPAVIDPRKLIVEWLEAEEATKSELASQITEVLTADATKNQLPPLAQAVGAVPGELDWTALSPSDCQPVQISLAVAERAPHWWLFDAAVQGGAKDAAAFRDGFQRLPEPDQAVVVVNALERWFGDERAESASALVRRVRTVMKAPVTVDVVTAAVSISLRIAHEDDSSSDLLALLGLVVAADGEVVRSAFDLLPADAPITDYLKVLAATKRSQRERMNLLAAVAQSEKSRAVFDAGVFSALSLEQLGEVLSSDPFPHLRAEGLDEHLVTSVRAATPSKLGAALAPVSQHPHLESLVSLDLLAKLASRDEASARVGRASMADVVGAAMEAGEEAHAGEISALKQEIEERDRQLELARADTQALTDKVASLDARLREALAATSSASLGELRQARLDVIQVIIDLAVRIGDAASVAESSDPLHDISAAIERELSGLDVVVVGRRGEVVPFDPAFFEGSDVADGSSVEIVRPAFVLEGGVTPLRYGLVRPVPEV